MSDITKLEPIATKVAGLELIETEARLIAAAPELLALAHDVATLAETGITFEELRRRARAAIAKAEGRDNV